MFLVFTFRDDPEPPAEFRSLPERLDDLWELLREQPGCETAVLARSPDDPRTWTICVLWQGMGSYRRAMSHVEVKTALGELAGNLLPGPGAFEVVRAVVGDDVRSKQSDRAPDADEVSPGADVHRSWPGPAPE